MSVNGMIRYFRIICVHLSVNTNALDLNGLPISLPQSFGDVGGLYGKASYKGMEKGGFGVNYLK